MYINVINVDPFETFIQELDWPICESPRCPWWRQQNGNLDVSLAARQWKRHHSQGLAGQQISGARDVGFVAKNWGCFSKSTFWTSFLHWRMRIQASTLSRAGGTAADLTGVFWLQRLWIYNKTVEPRQKTWWFRVYRGWNPTQLYRDYNEPL